LNDYEKNYEPLSIVLSTGRSNTELGLQIDGTELKNADPSAFCINGNLSLADSIIRIIISSNFVSIKANVLIGSEELRCMKCAIKPFNYKNEFMWGNNDKITIRSATQKLEVVNNNGSVTRILNQYRVVNRPLLISSGKYLSLINLPKNGDIVQCKVFDLTGKTIASHLSGNTIEIENDISSLITIGIVLANGETFSIHTVLTKK
jgi:hypothetical protein